ncbi:MAG: hypothetical protein RL689_2012 [Planctomycetota bacterium]|jgi:hypothetical protein
MSLTIAMQTQAAADPVVSRLLDDGVLVPLVMMGGVVLIVAINVVAGVLKTNARERSRREIAAYIAEGSMTPEQGERLMKAGKGGDKA